MFKNIFCEMNIKKVIHWGVAGGMGKGKLFYGQQPPSGESTRTKCGFNYQLLAVIY